VSGIELKRDPDGRLLTPGCVRSTTRGPEMDDETHEAGDADGEGGTSDAPGDDAPPTEAFGLLSDGTRLAVLRELYAAGPGASVRFSALHDAVDYDDSAGFNYHLQQLVPRFVRRTDDGYRLSAAGVRVVRAVRAGLYARGEPFGPVPVEGSCRDCGEAALTASYESELFSVDCGACGARVVSAQAPPSLVGPREPAGAVAAFDRWSRAEADRALEGLCPRCGGPLDPAVDPDPSLDRFDALPRLDCTVCGNRVVVSFGSVAVRDPNLRAFLDRHGVDLRSRPYWAVPQLVSGEHTTVESRDPWRVRVSFPAGEETCDVTVDGSLAVVETTDRRATDATDADDDRSRNGGPTGDAGT
jgi:ribosomal protein S27E